MEHLPDTVKERAAVITGAGSIGGLGEAMAKALLEDGHSVVLVDVDGDGLESVRSRLSTPWVAGRIGCVTADLTRPEEVERACDSACDAFGPVDILVNNAGVFHRSRKASTAVVPRRSWEVPVSTWQLALDVNISAAFLMTRALVGMMMERRWGRIVSITTSLDSMWRAGSAPYGPSKAAHEALITAMSHELAGSGVTANVLIPGGPTQTPMTDGVAEFDGATLLSPEVMTAPIRWLASDESGQWSGIRIVGRHWDPALPASRTSSAARRRPHGRVWASSRPSRRSPGPVSCRRVGRFNDRARAR